MNIHYNEDRARQLLSEINTSQQVQGGTGVQVLSRADMATMHVADVQFPPSVRLMEVVDGETVEAMFKTYGVIAGKVLPPLVARPYSPSMHTILGLRQHVKLTGLSYEGFDDDANTLRHVHALFQMHVHSRRVVDFDYAPYEGHHCLESHARYFTNRNLVPHDRPQRFLDGVDPEGILQRLQPASLIHSTDNVVEYCRREVEDDGSFRYTVEDPRTFREGDIVEMAFSFVGVSIRDGKMMLYMNLRALTLIDDSVRKDSEDAAMFARMSMNNRTPKRRVRFLSTSEGSAQYALKKHRSEPALKFTKLEFHANPNAKDDIDATVRTPAQSDESTTGSTESYVKVNDSDVLSSSSHSIDFTDTSDHNSSTEESTTDSDEFEGIDLAIHEAWEALQKAQDAIDSVEGVSTDEASVGGEGEEYFEFDIEPMVVDF